MPRTTDAPTDADLAELDIMLTEYEVYASYGGRPEAMQARVEELEIALTARVPVLVAEVRRLREFCDSLRPVVAEAHAARPVVALIERVATETYMGANEELLLMAKGRAFDRLIAAWDQLDHARALAARDGGGGG